MYTVEIQENKTLAPDAFMLIFDKPEGFRFLAGQFVHLQVLVGDRPLRRSYTIASAPHEETIQITIRTQEHGKVSPVLAQLKQGDTIHMIGPFGDFTRTEESVSVCIAAGSGITPFISYLRDAQASKDTREMHVLYSNKTQQDMLHAQELQRFAQQEHIHYTPTLTREEWEHRTGRITQQDLAQYTEATFYVCGSNPFIRAMVAHLTALHVPIDSIRLENYGNITS